MVIKLKSYRLKDTLKKKSKNIKRKMRRSGTGDIITGGITALIGVGLLSATSDAVSKI